MDTPSDVLTIKEASAYLRVTEPVLYRMARAGEVPAKKVGTKWRFSRKALDAWLAGGHGQRE